jgi:hypothetical protein
MNTPILFLVFNRPDTTKQVFEKIREAQPPKLYVAADGPREERVGEADKCEQVRHIATNVDWDCEVKTLFRDKNLGCKHAVSGAIDWFFDQEKMGIILEDDCVPNESFFRYCEELLHRYKDEEQVMTISGNNFQPERRTENSYYFSKYMHCWGWASWRKAWEYFDLEMEEWPHLKNKNFLSEQFSSKSAQDYWRNIFDRVHAGEIDSWDYIWQYAIWKQKGLNILPEVNLVSNIGFGEGGTHTKSNNSGSANMKTEELVFPLKHPQKITVHEKADEFTQKKIIPGSLLKRVYKKIKRLISN